MCNPTTTSNTHNSNNKTVIEKQAKPPLTHLYLTLYSLSNNAKDPQNPKPDSKKETQFGNPTISEIVSETKSLFNLTFPIALTALLRYSRSILSTLFLGHLGNIELAAGSFAIAFANISGYSVLSGLALGMEPLCAQAFGAQRPKLLSLTLHRSVMFLFSSIPISILWINMLKILLSLHQDPKITNLAHTYLLFSLHDLHSNSNGRKGGDGDRFGLLTCRPE